MSRYSAMAVDNSVRACCLLASCGIQRAEAAVAVGLQRAHTNLLGQGKALAVMGGGLVDIRGLATHGDVAEETAGMRLVAASCVGVGEIEEAFGERARLVYAADEKQRLAQLGEHECREEHGVPGGNALPASGP